MLTKEFWEKEQELQKKLHEINEGKLTKPIEVIEKKVEIKKPYSQRWKNFNKHPDNFRKL